MTSVSRVSEIERIVQWRKSNQRRRHRRLQQKFSAGQKKQHRRTPRNWLLRSCLRMRKRAKKESSDRRADEIRHFSIPAGGMRRMSFAYAETDFGSCRALGWRISSALLSRLQLYRRKRFAVLVFPLMPCRIGPIVRVLHVTVFDGIEMDVVDMRVVIVLVAD